MLKKVSFLIICSIVSLRVLAEAPDAAWGDFANVKPASMRDHLIDLAKLCFDEDALSCHQIGHQFQKSYSALKDDFVSNNVAAKYYEKSCSLGNGEGCNDLANLIGEDKTVVQDVSKDTLVAYYIKGCELGAKGGCYAAAEQKFGSGEFKEINPATLNFDELQEAIELLDEACKIDHGVACELLYGGRLVSSKKMLIREIKDLVRTLHAQACNLEIAQSCFAIATILDKGVFNDIVFSLKHSEEQKATIQALANKLYTNACQLGWDPAC